MPAELETGEASVSGVIYEAWKDDVRHRGPVQELCAQLQKVKYLI